MHMCHKSNERDIYIIQISYIPVLICKKSICGNLYVNILLYINFSRNIVAKSVYQEIDQIRSDRNHLLFAITLPFSLRLISIFIIMTIFEKSKIKNPYGTIKYSLYSNQDIKIQTISCYRTQK